MPHIINANECAVCGACEADCPTGAISIHSSNQFFVIDPKKCTDCGDCVDLCPTEAIAPDQTGAATTATAV
jgi:NAD-dependent dihydropyrimidine dehydrogenase PreA subunit